MTDTSPSEVVLRIVALGAGDASAYNAFLSEGVVAHPDTLRISAADIVRWPFSTDATDENVTFAATDAESAWLGVVTVEREGGRDKRRHIAWIVRMVVDDRASGKGVGRALLRAAVARARAMPGVAKVNLTVAAHNTHALHLYASEGFREFAREPDAFRDPTSREELSMSLALEVPSAQPA